MEMLETINEAGCLAETRLFKGNIDWIESANKGFNLSYCKDFIKRFFGNKYVEFDLDISEV